MFPEDMWSEIETRTLLNFLIEQSENALSPLNISQVSRDYKNISGTTRSLAGVSRKIWQLRTQIDKLIVDDDAKTILFFALRAPDAKGNRHVNWRNNPRNVEWSPEEQNSLVQFLVEKSNRTKCRLDLTMLPRLYKEEYISNRPIFIICLQIFKIRDEISELPDIDELTKEKLMFALNARRRAPPPAPPLQDDIAPILDRLAQISKTRSSPINETEFMKICMKANVLTPGALFYPQYQEARKRIAYADKYDLKTRIRMLFVSGARVCSLFEKSLRENAIVELDRYGVLSLYVSHDRSLLLDRRAQENPLKRPAEDKRARIRLHFVPPPKIPKLNGLAYLNIKKQTDPEIIEVKLEEPDV